MKLIIETTINKNYFINVEGYLLHDEDVAIMLNLTLEEYTTILMKYNAHYDSEIMFKNINDINAAIEELELYIIMNKLIGEL